MIELGRRRQRLPAPPYVVWRDLCSPRIDGVRPWLTLLDDEREPEVLASVEPTQVVWSSLWLRRPDDQVILNVSPADGGSWLEFVWLSGEREAPSEATIGHVRKRLSTLLYGDLRSSYGQ